jgi:putative hydrolase of the HAD superfamily
MKNISTLYIDLDGTVYDKHNGMWEEMSARIGRFMNEVVGIPTEEVIPTREKYYRDYGSSLRGLQFHHEIDPEDYLAYVHDLNLNHFLSPDLELRRMLESIPQPKWILTNSDRNHSRRVLDSLGLNGIFEGILDVWTMNYIPKPDRRVYEYALRLTGNPNPAETIFIDDTLMNLGVPHQKGIKTVWVNSSGSHPSADFTISRLHELPSVLQSIQRTFQFTNKIFPDTPQAAIPLVIS